MVLGRLRCRPLVQTPASGLIARRAATGQHRSKTARTSAGERVSQRARRALDDAVQTKSAEIVGHRTGGIAGQRATE